MNRLLTITRREYLERVRSRAFLVSTLLGPILVAGFMLAPSLLLQRQRGQALRIAVVDASGALRGGVEAELRRQRVAGQPRFVVTPRRACRGGARQAALRDLVVASSTVPLLPRTPWPPRAVLRQERQQLMACAWAAGLNPSCSPVGQRAWRRRVKA